MKKSSLKDTKPVGGRPSKYCVELVENAQRYVDEYEDQGDVVPTIAGLAKALGVSRMSLHNWSKDEDKPEFGDILDGLLATQETVLLNKGLTGEFNSNIAKLMLGKHGYSDKHDSNIHGSFSVKIDGRDAGTL